MTCFSIYRTTIYTDRVQTYVGQHKTDTQQSVGGALTDGYMGSGNVIKLSPEQLKITSPKTTLICT